MVKYYETENKLFISLNFRPHFNDHGETIISLLLVILGRNPQQVLDMPQLDEEAT